jgi:hypothetical protein
MILLVTTVASAGDGGGGFSFGKILPAVTGVGGALVGIFAVLPLIFKLKRKVEKAAKVTRNMVEKYRDKIQEGEVKQDFRVVVRAYDDVTEGMADVLGKLKLKKAENWLRDLINGRDPF